MSPHITIFAAQYLVFIESVLTGAILAWILNGRPRLVLVQWATAMIAMLLLSYAFARIGAALYYDPRPFTQDHVAPLIAHAANNGFPSDHGLLAASLVAAILLVDSLWTLPLVVFAILVDWARVAAGIQHVQDVLGSAILVAFATLIALLIAPLLTRQVLSRWPEKWQDQPAPRTGLARRGNRTYSR